MPDRTLLVIDDDPMLRFTVSAYLEDSGFLCLEAASGLEGLELFGRHPVDLVVTDLRMPGLDGLEVLTRLKASSPGTPVVVLTGATDAVDAEEALALGAAACLTKPVANLELLVTLLNTILTPGAHP